MQQLLRQEEILRYRPNVVLSREIPRYVILHEGLFFEGF